MRLRMHAVEHLSATLRSPIVQVSEANEGQIASARRRRRQTFLLKFIDDRSMEGSDAELERLPRDVDLDIHLSCNARE